MERGGARRLSREFKLAALARMAAGENVSALGRELGVRRKLLYQWRDTVRCGGAEALRGVGRPPAAERLARGPVRPRVAVPAAVAVPDELALAQAQIAALERKIGQQVLELDFFGQALQLMEQVGRAASAPCGAAASTASSGPGRSGKAD
jgi:transposase